MSEREPTFSERLELRGFANLPSLPRELEDMHDYADKTLFTMPDLRARYEFWRRHLSPVGPMRFSRPDLDTVVRALKFEIDMRVKEGVQLKQGFVDTWPPESPE
jgi:hypothetical protein